MARGVTGGGPTPPDHATEGARRNGCGHARVESIHVRNFRSLRDVEVRLGDIAILIGANGVGKTSVLDALAIFASEKPAVGEGDYHRDADRVDITLTVDPGGHAVEGRFLRDGLLRLQRSFSRNGEEDRRGTKAEVRRNRHFDGVRGAARGDKRKKANELRSTMCPGLPEYTSRNEFAMKLDEYEYALSRDPGRKNCHYLEFAEYPGWQELVKKMLMVVPVPAMKDIAADGEEGAGSFLSELMGLAIRDAKRGNAELRKISKAMDSMYATYREAFRGTIDELGEELARAAGAYMDCAEFEILLEGSAASASHPSASIRIGDGRPEDASEPGGRGFMTPVGRAGSGLQRVYLLALLDTIAGRRRAARAGDGAESPPALRLVAIDEPELYQHPQRQLRMLRSLIGAAEGDAPVSIVCSTHSPYMVELRRVDALRILRRGEKPAMITAGELSGLDGRLRSDSTWLDMNATHWITEGFFARRVVVVEGMSDRNALLAAARAAGADLDGCEISIVPAGGVENVDMIAKLYSWFGIPAYLVWDLDHKYGKCAEKTMDRNALLASIARGERESGSPTGTRVLDTHAHFQSSLTEVLSDELLGSGGLLGGLPEHRSLREAAIADGRADRDAGGRHCGCHECKRLRRTKRAAGTGPASGARKRVLKSKMNVHRMLEEVRMGDAARFEELTVVRIVRTLEEIGECEGDRQAERGGTVGA